MTNRELIAKLQEMPPDEEVRVFDGYRSYRKLDVLGAGSPQTEDDKREPIYPALNHFTFIRFKL
jgi:hypothetical protein